MEGLIENMKNNLKNKAIIMAFIIKNNQTLIVLIKEGIKLAV